MSQTSPKSTHEFPAALVLGIEGGGTKTEWILTSEGRHETVPEVRTGLLPPSNMKLTGDAKLLEIFAVLPREGVDRVGICLAGCATEQDRIRLSTLARKVWPTQPLYIGSDRDSAFAASFRDGEGIVAIAGTGAAVTGRHGGQMEKAGGWGQLLGDRGSGYHLAMQGLRCVLSSYDVHGVASPLAHDILRRLGLNRLQDLVDWVGTAGKMDVARLAPAIFQAAKEGDSLMLDIIEDGAEILAEFITAVSRRLGREDIPVRLFGGIFVHHPEYCEAVARRLQISLPKAEVAVSTASGAEGAAWLASRDTDSTRQHTLHLTTQGGPQQKSTLAELAEATTEQRNPRSQLMDTLPTRALVSLFVEEERYVQEALAAVLVPLVQGVDLVAARLQQGGSLFYMGAGTSGRLGVLDASEIPPTFGADPSLVQGIIAGGAPALQSAVEGAEDQEEAGALAIVERGVSAKDVVCGIAASGRTPFVLAGLRRAREIGAATLLLTCNPARRPSTSPWDVEIDLPTGPELVTGSTRLKAGTATKLVLNILSTCAMVRLGKVKGNLMINVSATNEKLRDRAIRLVTQLSGASREEAQRRLEIADWNVGSCIS